MDIYVHMKVIQIIKETVTIRYNYFNNVSGDIKCSLKSPQLQLSAMYVAVWDCE